jgi:hypothetical protein
LYGLRTFESGALEKGEREEMTEIDMLPKIKNKLLSISDAENGFTS